MEFSNFARYKARMNVPFTIHDSRSLASITWKIMLEKPVVLFDGVCNYCNRVVNFAIRNDRNAKLKFTPLQSEIGKQLVKQFEIPPGTDSVILIDNNKVYTYSNAALRGAKYLDWPAKMLYAFIIIPAFIRQPIYKWIAKNRYKWFGKKDSCMVPGPGVKERFLDDWR